MLDGSLDPRSLIFSTNADDYALKIILAPARTRCLCCGGTAGNRNVITPVGLGTSAAVKVVGEGLVEVLAEANKDRPGHDGKERLLVFSDSRQEAAHQARFIIFASRYDRMRRRIFGKLQTEKVLTLQRAVELLGEQAEQERDNPHVEEGVDLQLLYIRQVLLDEMRVRGCLSREMLRYHPQHLSCPEHVKKADWERRVKYPRGYAASGNGEPVAFRDAAEIPPGITCNNAWRKPKSGGVGPSLERLLKRLLDHFGGLVPDADQMVELMTFLRRGSFLVATDLFGFSKRIKLMQVNADIVRFKLATNESRLRCDVCGKVRSGTTAGMPCPRCHGVLIHWLDEEVNTNRTVKQIKKPMSTPLVAGEHTAQVTTADRAELEDNFKASPEKSKVNLLACSPTLEMGIDVGGLDAVIMRNIPPRPDNYAQRGGRAGRRSRVGLVLGYARNTPHDQYFYDKPREMIAGEVPVPAMSLGNRDVLIRHLYAIVFGAAEPGLAGRMLDYVTPKGEVVQDSVSELIEAVGAQTEHALTVAKEAWGADVLANAGLDDDRPRSLLQKLPERIQHVMDCTARQVHDLYQSVEFFAEGLDRRPAAMRASELINRLLGKRTEGRYDTGQADDRSAGYPLRRLAEFGILPGYEFPSEPAALRLLGDKHEEDPVSVTRRFGIGQFQPEATVYARTKRWKVIGLDTSSPWNPRSEGPTWEYRVCNTCDLRLSVQCGTASLSAMQDHGAR